MSELIDHKRMRELAKAVHGLRSDLDELWGRAFPEDWDAVPRFDCIEGKHLVSIVGNASLLSERLSDLVIVIMDGAVPCLGVTPALRMCLIDQAKSGYWLVKRADLLRDALCEFGMTTDSLEAIYAWDGHDVAQMDIDLHNLVNRVLRTALLAEQGEWTDDREDV